MRQRESLMRTLLCSSFSLALLASFSTSADEEITVLDRLKSCDLKVASAAAEQIVTSAVAVDQPSELHSVADILFAQGRKDEAVFWFWVAQLRGRYQSGIPRSDLFGFPALLNRASQQPINNYALQDTRKFDLILTRVLEWDRNTPNPFREKYSTADGLTRVEAMYRSFEDLRTRVAAEREQLEHQARAAEQQVLQAHASYKRACRKELVSPAQARAMINLERGLVVDFVRNQADVMRAVGAGFGADVGSYTLEHIQLLPSRYEVTVKGEGVAFAIVDVSRNAGKAEFTLACVTRKSLWEREVFTDPCKQPGKSAP
jgi:hypothetical protein